MSRDSDSPAGRVLVMALGSVLMGDDAFGPWALEHLKARWEFPDGVELLDAGTPGPELGHYLLGLRALVAIDTVRAGDHPPGTVLQFTREQLVKAYPQPRMSPHDPSLKDALLTADVAGEPPGSVMLVGTVPERVELGAGLSETVAATLPKVEGAVIAELRRLGLDPTARAEPEEPELWWEPGGGGGPPRPGG